MATKSRNGTRSDDNSTTSTAAFDPARMQQGAQQRLARAAEATSQLIRGAELWSQLQLNLFQRSGQSWREAAERMRAATNPLDLIGAQNQLLMNGFVQCFQLAHDVAQAAASVQQGAANQAAGRDSEPREEAGSAAAEMVPTMTLSNPMASMMQSPMVQAWQSMMANNPMGMNGAFATGAAGR